MTANLMKRSVGVYLWTVAWILLCTSLGKICSAGGAAPILDLPEDLLPLSNRQVLLLVGTIEMGIYFLILLAADPGLKLVALAWLGSNFLLYRIAVKTLNLGTICPCMGSLTSMLPVRPAIIDEILSVAAFYIFVGSFFFLLTRRMWDEGNQLRRSITTLCNPDAPREPSNALRSTGIQTDL